MASTLCLFLTITPYHGDAPADYCLYDYYVQVYKHRHVNGVLFERPHPQHECYSKFLRKDTTTVPTLLGKLLFVNPDSPDRKKVNDYYCLIVSLFFPWCAKRTPKSSDESWTQFVENNEHRLCPHLLRFISNLSLLHKSKEDTHIHQLQLRAQEETDPSQPDAFSDDSSTHSGDS